MANPDSAARDSRTRFHRRAARMLVVDEEDRLLLFHGPALVAGAGGCYFYTVGGAIEPGETPREAAVRELREETGMVANPESLIGPIARCRNVQELLTGGFFSADEWFFWWRCTDASVRLDGLDEAERAETTGFVWLSLNDLETAPLTVLPRSLPAFMRRVLCDGIPDHPIDLAWDRVRLG